MYQTGYQSKTRILDSFDKTNNCQEYIILKKPLICCFGWFGLNFELLRSSSFNSVLTNGEENDIY